MCNGAATVQGLFHEMKCYDCNATGLVDNETGEALQPEDVTLQLQLLLRQQREENNQLRRQLRELQQQDNSRGYGAAGQRYHGD